MQQQAKQSTCTTGIKPLLSVVVPAFNVEGYIDKCLSSIGEEHQDLIEIVVVNDGSTDSTSDSIDKHRWRQNIKIVNQSNKGAGAARNTGLQASTGDFIWFLDPDDYALRGFFEQLLPFLKDSSLELIYFDSTNVNLDSRQYLSAEVLNPPKAIHRYENGVEFIEEHGTPSVAWRYIVRRTVLTGDELYFLENLPIMEDVLFSLNLMLLIQKMVYVEANFHRYVLTPNSMSRGSTPRYYGISSRGMAKAVEHISEIIQSTPDGVVSSMALSKIRSKQESILIYSLIRGARSEMSIQTLASTRLRFKERDYFPITHFSIRENKKPKYKLIVSIVDSRFCMPFMILIRFLSRLSFMFRAK